MKLLGSIWLNIGVSTDAGAMQTRNDASIQHPQKLTTLPSPGTSTPALPPVVEAVGTPRGAVKMLSLVITKLEMEESPQIVGLCCDVLVGEGWGHLDTGTLPLLFLVSTSYSGWWFQTCFPPVLMLMVGSLTDIFHMG